MVPVAPVGCLAPVVVGQARPRSTGALIPILPPSSSSAFGANSLPRASSNRLPFHRSPGGNHLIVLAFTTPLAVPIRTVFDPSIGPKYPPCSKRETKGQKRRVDAAAASTTLTVRMPSSNLDHTGGGLDRQLDRSDMPLMTFFTELSAAPLDCGSPSADVSCTTPLPNQLHCPEQCKNGKFVVTPKHNSAVLQTVQIFGNRFHNLLAIREMHSFLEESSGRKLIWSLRRAQPGRNCLRAARCRHRCFDLLRQKKVNLMIILEFWNRPHLLCGHHHDVSLGSTSPPHTCSAPRKETGITCQHVVLNFSRSRI